MIVAVLLSGCAADKQMLPTELPQPTLEVIAALETKPDAVTETAATEETTPAGETERTKPASETKIPESPAPQYSQEADDKEPSEVKTQAAQPPATEPVVTGPEATALPETKPLETRPQESEPPATEAPEVEQTVPPETEPDPVPEAIDTAELEAYGRAYASGTYGYNGTSACHPGTGAGFFPAATKVITTMDEGRRYVRQAVDSQYKRDMAYGYLPYEEIDGVIVRCPINVSVDSAGDNTYTITVYYGGTA